MKGGVILRKGVDFQIGTRDDGDMLYGQVPEVPGTSQKVKVPTTTYWGYFLSGGIDCYLLRCMLRSRYS